MASNPREEGELIPLDQYLKGSSGQAAEEGELIPLDEFNRQEELGEPRSDPESGMPMSTRGYKAIAGMPSLVPSASDLGGAAAAGVKLSVAGLRRQSLESARGYQVVGLSNEERLEAYRLAADTDSPLPYPSFTEADSTFYGPEQLEAVRDAGVIVSRGKPTGTAAYRRGLQEDPEFLEREGKIADVAASGREATAEIGALREKNPSLIGRSALTAAQSLPQSAAALAIGLATRNPVLAAAAMAPGTQGSSYQGYREPSENNPRGLSPARSRGAANIDSFIESATELLPFTSLLKTDQGALAKLAKFLVAEIPGESIATVTQELNSYLQAQPDDATIGDVMEALRRGSDQLPETWLSTIMGGSVQSGAASAVEAGVKRLNKPGLLDPEDLFSDDILRQISVEATGRPGGLPNEAPAVPPIADDATPQEEEQPEAEPGTGPQSVANPEIERYQFQRAQGEQIGAQIEIQPLTEEAFQYYVRPILPVGHANTLDDYLERHPNASHVRLRVQPDGSFKLDKGRSVGPVSILRPGAQEARKVGDFNEDAAKQYGGIDAERANRRDPNALDPENDSILTAIAKLGGVSRDEASSQGIDPKEFGRRDHRLNYTFRRDGRSIDELAELLREFGYPVQDQNSLLDAINNELGGGEVRSTQSSLSDQAAEAEQRGAEQQALAEPVTIDDLLQSYSQYPGALEDDSDVGLLHAENEYPPDFDAGARKLSDLAEVARMIDPDATETALQLGSDSEAAQRLWGIINGEDVTDAEVTELPEQASEAAAEQEAGPQQPVESAAADAYEDPIDIRPPSMAGENSPASDGPAYETTLTRTQRRAVLDRRKIQTRKGPIELRYVGEDGYGGYDILAYNDKDELVGSLGYAQAEEAEGLRYNPDVLVEHDYQRNGIASAMYDYAEELGGKIPLLTQKGQVRSDAGQAFREGREAKKKKPTFTVEPLNPDFKPPAAEKAVPPKSTFKTAKGSTYEVDADGRTTRNKGARSDLGHEGDSGAKKRSDKTLYFAANPASLSVAGMQGLGSKGARVVVSDGHASLLTWNDKQGKWGIAPSGRNIPFTTEPGVGKFPLELWNRGEDISGFETYKAMHAGNAIVEVGRAEESDAPADSTQSKVEAAAAQANPEPTPAQAEAGNYQKGHVRLHGLDISIENPKGSTRRSKPGARNPWEVVMPAHYGYIKGTVGADDEHFDVFLGDHAEEDGKVFVVDQATVEGRKFDESKALIGFFDVEEAVKAYKGSFAGTFGRKMLGQALGWRTFENVAAFREWLGTADLHQPATPQKAPQPKGITGAASEPLTLEGLLDAYQQDLPSRGGLTSVPIKQTRARIGAGKAEFDAFMLEQSDAGKIELIAHDMGAAQVADADQGVKRGSTLFYYWRPVAESKEAPAEAEDGVAGAAPTKRLGDWVAGKLKSKTAVTWDELFKAGNLFFGGTQASGKYSVKDAYDAMELGVNLFLRKQDGIYAQGSATVAQERITELQGYMDLLPTQSKRTAEQDAFQQFSTPPTHSFLASWVANFQPRDAMLEPSAGIGGLTVFANRGLVPVVVNELSPRRREILETMGGFKKIMGEDAEQIANLLPAELRPTVVIMNPPFSNAATRGVKKDTMIGARHVEQALKTLQPGGRLVAVVGTGMAHGKPTFNQWWRDIEAKYNVRADIGIDGEAYRKYGTSFDNRILVIDNTGPTAGTPMIAEVKTVQEAAPLLEAIRNDRARPDQARQSAPQAPAKPSSGAAVAEPVAQPDSAASAQPDAVRDAGRKPGGRANRSKPAESGNAGERAAAPVAGVASPSNAPTDDTGGRPAVGGERAEPVQVPAAGSQDPVGGALQSTVSGIELGSTEQAKAGELTGGVFESYQPQRLKVAGARPHPGKLVESAAMASVSAVVPTYVPNLPMQVIKGFGQDGGISLAQLEPVVYAGQAHQTVFVNGERQGYFIGDGTGVGKGREIAAIILDNQRRGQKKAIWISAKRDLMNDAKRDMRGVGMDDSGVFFQGGDKGKKLMAAGTDGVLFTTYSTLRSAEKKTEENKTPQTRLDQLLKWAGEDYDGVVIFDESHNAGNLLPGKGKRGKVDPSLQAMAVADLQRRLPKARVVYVSATGATEVSNLAYASRLGIWGEGRSFTSVENFVNEVQKGGLAAMELVAKDLKALGLYNARSLSFEDVRYDRIDHPLSADQREIYDEMAKAWQAVLENVKSALDITEASTNRNAKGAALSQLWGSQLRFFNQVITSMQMPSVIEDVEKQLAAGNAVVMQLVNTNEAVLDRKLRDKEDDELVEDLDMTPRENLIQYIRKSFPVVQYEQFTDADGNKHSRPATDSNNNQVLNREAVALRDALIEKMEQIRVPDGPLEYLFNHFGPDAIAEVTGRSKRVYRNKEGKLVIEKRTDRSSRDDAEAFQADRKRIMVFSDAGGTGFSFQADLTKKNQRQRIHYLVQPGWRANNAVQGFGRTHRTNQASAPEYKLVSTDVPAQKRFISSIARRLDQLGALTKGQRDTANQGLFSAKDNLESEIAEDALFHFIVDLKAGQIDGMTFDEVMGEMGLTGIVDTSGALIESKVPGVPQFLNRMLSLTLERQEQVFGVFSARLEREVDAAIAAGTLDQGMETIEALGVDVKRDEVVYVEPRTGAETRYVHLELTKRRLLQKFPDPTSPYNKGVEYFKNLKSGKVWAVIPMGTTTEKGGRVLKRFAMEGTGSKKYGPAHELGFSGANYAEIEVGEAKQLWDRENELLGPTRKEDAHLITGAVLPIWDRLPGRIRVVRTQSQDGRRYLGRYIESADLDAVLKNLKVDSALSKMTPADLIAEVRGGRMLRTANGWEIFKVKVSNEQRIEIRNIPQWPPPSLEAELERAGVFTERISYKTRYFLPNTAGAAEILAQLTASRPVVELKDIAEVRLNPSLRPAPLTAEDVKNQAKERTLRRAQQHFSRISGRWQGVRVIVRWDETDLPLKYYRSLAKHGVGNTAGFYVQDTGDVYLLMGNVASIAEAEEVLFHEVEGHLSVQQFFGKGIVPFLNRVYLANPVAVKRVGIEYGFYTPTGAIPAGMTEAQARINSADEYIGLLAQQINSNSPRSWQSLWQWLVSHFADLMRAAGWRSFKPTETEIRGMLIRTQGALRGKRRKNKSREAAGAIGELGITPGLLSRAQAGPAQGSLAFAHSWDSPTDSRMDNFRYQIQDKHIDTRRVIEAIAAANFGLIEDAVNVRQREELYSGRVAKRLEDFMHNEMRPLMLEMAEKNISFSELNQFLLARHVPEATAEYESKNPGRGDGMAGMTLKEAQDYMDGLTPTQLADFTSLASAVDRILDGTRTLHVDYGLDGVATVDSWRSTYQYYVPLFRAEMDEGPGASRGSGQGFSVRGPGTRQRTGSHREVADIMASIVTQREKAVTRGEKNRIANALVGLAIENPNDEFWKINTPRMVAYVDETTGLTVHRAAPNWRNDPNVVTARSPQQDGSVREISVVFNNDNDRAVRMAAALKNLDEDQLGWELSTFAKATRWFAMINTQYNPVFGPYNMLRDVQESMLNLSTTAIAGQQRRVARHLLPALKGISGALLQRRLGGQSNTVWAQRWEHFQRVGGKTGYRDMFATNAERAKQLRSEMKAISAGPIGGKLRFAAGMLSDYNEALENATRLSVFQVGIESGLTDAQAASIAKNISVNFNRRGNRGLQIGALYAFFNASVQGSTRLLQTIKGPAGKKIILGGILLGAINALWLLAAGLDDVPEFVQQNSFVIPTGNGHYIAWPYPLGLRVLPNIGRIGSQYAIGGFREGGKFVTDLLSSIAHNFNPIGDAGFSLQTILPTVTDPFAAVAENRDFAGNTIAIEDMNRLSPTPGHARAKAGASDMGIWMSHAFNAALGGNEYRPSEIWSPTPDQIDYLIGQGFGGAGRTAMNTVTSIKGAFTGDDVPLYKIPLLGRLFGTVSDASGESKRFYDNVKHLNTLQNELQGRAADRANPREFLMENRLAALGNAAQLLTNRIGEIRKQRRLLESQGQRDRAHELDKAITDLMQRFNERVRELEKPD